MSVILHGLTDFSNLSWYGWMGAGHLVIGSRIPFGQRPFDRMREGNVARRRAG